MKKTFLFLLFTTAISQANLTQCAHMYEATNFALCTVSAALLTSDVLYGTDTNTLNIIIMIIIAIRIRNEAYNLIHIIDRRLQNL